MTVLLVRASGRDGVYYRRGEEEIHVTYRDAVSLRV